ncbi:MAG TPA: ROK family protein [Candidatus Saccharimonadales bacterium]|nr:ROK family protein [Candidatus Saccharimonadales bacterium]
MYIGVDIGGTKTLVGCLNDEGVIQQKIKFPTPHEYKDFLKELANAVDKLSTNDFRAAGVAIPGKLDRQHGRVIALGNLPWRNAPIQTDIEHIVHCPVAIENDAKLAALSEAMLLKEHRRVLYITVSTGIGTGVVQDGKLAPSLIDAESGQMWLEHKGKLARWETFASGKAIVEQFGKQASEIQDSATWKIIAHNITLGLLELIAVIQPDAIVFGGAVSDYFDRFAPPLAKELSKYETPLTPTPIILQAKRPEEAVLFGCYDLAKTHYGHSA